MSYPIEAIKHKNIKEDPMIKDRSILLRKRCLFAENGLKRQYLIIRHARNIPIGFGFL